MEAKPTLKRTKQRAVPGGPRSEALVDRAVVRYLKSLGSRCAWFKMGVDGWPDRILCYKGYFIGIEEKSEREGHTATARQAQRIREIRDAGGIAIVSNTVEDVKGIIARVDALHRIRVDVQRVLPGQLSLQRIDEMLGPFGLFIETPRTETEGEWLESDVESDGH